MSSDYISEIDDVKIPGLLIYYNICEDNVEPLSDILENNDKTILYDKSSYLILGVVISSNNNEITVLTPFFIHNEIVVSKKKNMLLNGVESLVKNNVKEYSKQYSKDFKFSVINKEQLMSIRKNGRAVIDGLRDMNSLIINNDYSFDDILMNGIVLCKECDIFLGGLGPEIIRDNYMVHTYKADPKLNGYHKLSAEEFYNNCNNSPGVIYSDESLKADIIDEILEGTCLSVYSYEDFIKRFGTEFLFEYYVPVVATFELS